MQALPSGEIITFYSYKGGVGRSCAVANVGWILASAGRRVLLIDWDLDSPGLATWFAPLLRESGSQSTAGLLDLFENYMGSVLSPRTNLPADVLPYVQSVEYDFPESGFIDLLGPGRQDAAYPARVNSFPWETFYQKLGGSGFLDALRESLRNQYDYVLIDSPGGVSDYSGICTVQMPDKLVVCFALNRQSMAGSAQVARSVIEQRRSTPVRIFPVPMRLERFEKDLLDQGLRYARELFQPFVEYSIDDYWSRVAWYYTPFYAFGEVLAAMGDGADRVDSLLASALRLASVLTDGRVQKVPPVPEEERRRFISGQRVL